MKHGKKYVESTKLVESAKVYESAEAFDLVCKTAKAKFDETVELHVRLGVDSRHADQQVRGAVVLPNGTGKKVRTLVFCKADKEQAAKDAGADYIADNDTVAKINGGWMDFEVVIATPDMMGVVGRLGKVLGPRGLMPNPKTGTVTMDVAKAVKEIKGGRIEFRVDKHANLAFIVGKASFTAEQLTENYATVLDEVLRLKPTSAKGRYLIKGAVATTMGPGIPLDVTKVKDLLEK